LSIKIGDRFEPAGLVGVPPSAAAIDLDSVRCALQHEWSQADDLFTAFLEFRGLDEDAKANWLAYAVSQSLKASLDTGARHNAFLSGLGALMEIDAAAHWRPGAENFFDRIKKGQILKVLGQIDPELPARYATAKKGELAVAAAKLCAGETIAEPAVKERAAAWLPDEMRFTARSPAEREGATGDPSEAEPAEIDSDSEVSESDGTDLLGDDAEFASPAEEQAPADEPQLEDLSQAA
jgi:ParB family chromosome partitioning protein